MGFKGSLASINLADIFQNLALNQQTGTIKITTQDEHYYVFFERGAVSLFSRDKDKGGKLGEMVVGRGLATLDQIEEALQKQQATQVLLGEILVEMNVLAREDVANLIRYQIEEAVYDLFHLDKGDFEFIDGPPLPEIFDEEQKAVQINVNTSSLIMEAARRIDEWERMKEIVPSLEEIFIPQPALVEKSQNGELEPLDARILDFLDGGRDVLDIIEESSFSRYEVVKAVAGFLEQGMIRSATLDDLAEAGEMCIKEGRTRHVIKIYERMLAKGVDNPDLRARLAEAATELGEVDKAAIHYGVFARHHLDQGNEDHAIIILQKIVKLIPKHVPSRKLLARILSSRGQIDEAVTHYVVLVQALVESHRLDEAEEFAKEGLDLSPDNLDILQALSHIYMLNKDRPAASVIITRMGEVLERSGRARAAVEMYRRAAQIDATNAPAKASLARIEERERSEQAKPVLLGLFILVVLTLLAAAALAGVNEMLARQSCKAALERYLESPSTEKQLWAAMARPSIGVEPEEAIRAIREKRLQADERVLVDSLRLSRKRVETEKVLARAEGLFKKHDYAAATPMLEEVADVREFSELADKARGMLSEIAATDKYLADYRKWLAANEGRPNMLGEELQRKLDLLRRCPWSEEARSVKLPVLVKTSPEGADIYVGGRFRGSSPLPLYYTPGERLEITATLRGYRRETRTIAERIDGVELVIALEREALALSLGANVDIPPLSLENLIIVANRAGKISAVERMSRQVVWSVAASEHGLGDVTSPMVYYSGRLYFGIADGTLRVFSVGRTSARGEWAALGGARILARPAIRNLELLNQRLFVFVADESGIVSCIEAANGNTVWA
ncbi:MAG TPA: DUF4388 domain-containing protein, partial [Planctomycetes bacterium]|nr:DUF4388 domain-containing protein [Planctomycetota bacterium]